MCVLTPHFDGDNLKLKLRLQTTFFVLQIVTNEEISETKKKYRIFVNVVANLAFKGGFSPLKVWLQTKFIVLQIVTNEVLSETK